MLGYDFLGINDWILLTLVSSDLFSRGTEVFMIRYSLIVGITAFVMLLIVIVIVWSYRRSLKRIQSVALTEVLSEFWVLQEKVDMKVSAFSFASSLLIFGYL